jgi:hypothetical protein
MYAVDILYRESNPFRADHRYTDRTIPVYSLRHRTYKFTNSHYASKMLQLVTMEYYYSYCVREH